MRLYLSLTSIVHFVSAATVDVCQSLCHEFTAARRGEGYDLCDAPSFCRDNFCTNLFWSHTEDGVHGLIYSTSTDGLSMEELTSPVTCHQASQLIPSSRNEVTISVDGLERNRFQTALEVFLRLPPVSATLQARVNATGTVEADFRDHLETVDQVNETLVPRSLGPIWDRLARMRFRGLTRGMPPISRVSYLVEYLGLSTSLLIRGTRRCVGCRRTHESSARFASIDLTTIPMNMVTLDLQDMIDLFSLAEVAADCVTCRRRYLHFVERHIVENPQVIAISLQRDHRDSDYMMTSIRVPLRLTIGDREARLVAIIHQESIHGYFFANFYHNGRWWEYKDYRIVPDADLVDKALSSTATAFIYSPVME
jgi:hypothetical protein